MELHRPLASHRRILASERKNVEVGLDGNFLVVGERINPTGKKKLQAQLREGKLDLVREMAMAQEENGAAILDINMGMNGIDEKEMMKQVIYEVAATVDCPLCLDTSHIDVMEEALRVYPGRALINSVSLETEKIEHMLPLAKKYGAMFVLLPLSDEGLPKDAKEKHEIIDTVYDRAQYFRKNKTSDRSETCSVFPDKTSDEERISTSMPELDRVLGGDKRFHRWENDSGFVPSP